VTALLSGYGGQQSQGEQFQKPFSEATAQALDQAGEQARLGRSDQGLMLILPIHL
jgi:hypothetical protein